MRKEDKQKVKTENIVIIRGTEALIGYIEFEEVGYRS